MNTGTILHDREGDTSPVLSVSEAIVDLKPERVTLRRSRTLPIFSEIEFLVGTDGPYSGRSLPPVMNYSRDKSKVVIPVFRPKEALLDGVKILDPVLRARGFQFQFRLEGRGSGGNFAWGEFVREDRRLELHFRQSLGLVRYHVGDQNASHESYMRQLGAWDQCRYPGFSEDPAVAFHDLAHDLGLADDFLSGSAAVLRTAAATEAFDTAEQNKRAMAGYVGDVRQRQDLRERFREGSYDQVVALAERLKYPDQMTESERRMVEISRERTLS